MVVYHHSHLQCNQEGHNFLTSGFIALQSLNFERSLSPSSGPQSSLVVPCKISLGGSAFDNLSSKLMNSWNRPNFSWASLFWLESVLYDKLCHIIVFDLMNNFIVFIHSSFPETPIQSRREIGISQNQGVCTMMCSAFGGLAWEAPYPYLYNYLLHEITTTTFTSMIRDITLINFCFLFGARNTLLVHLYI